MWAHHQGDGQDEADEDDGSGNAYWMIIPSSSFSVEVSAASTSLMSLKTKMKIRVIEALLLHLLHYHQVPHPQ